MSFYSDFGKEGFIYLSHYSKKTIISLGVWWGFNLDNPKAPIFTIARSRGYFKISLSMRKFKFYFSLRYKSESLCELK